MMMATRPVRSKRLVTRLFVVAMQKPVYRLGLGTGQRLVRRKTNAEGRLGRWWKRPARLERYSSMVPSTDRPQVKPTFSKAR